MSSQQNAQILDFGEEIVPTHANRIGTSELLSRLQRLLSKLVEMDQDFAERDSILSVAHSLVHKNLLSHKDKSVRAYVCCCIVEVLRLCAPDAPYTISQLEKAFETIIKLLPGLEDPESVYYPQLYHILESLSVVKSAVLIVDFPAAETFLTSLFRLFFDLARKGISKNIEVYMLDILQQLINEASIIPPAVVNTLLAQLVSGTSVQSFVGPSENSKRGGGFQLARNILHECSNRLQRYISQYFSEIILETKDILPEENVPREFVAAHNLALELWTYAPSTLLNVVPQLENELLAEHSSIRLLAVETVRLMIKIHTLWSDYPQVWNAFLGRVNDKLVEIRTACTQGLINAALNPLASQDIIQLIMQLYEVKLADTDERVRVSAIEALGSLPYETLRLTVPVHALKLSADRLRDRKYSVRTKAIQTLSALYNASFAEQISGDDFSRQACSWIPSSLLNVFYVNDEPTNAAAELSFFEVILNALSLDTSARVSRILYVVQCLDDQSLRVFYMLLQRQSKYMVLLSRFIDCCVDYNGSVMDTDEEIKTKRLTQVIELLSSKSPNQKQMEQDLWKFAKLNDRQCYKTFRETINLQNSFEDIHKFMKHLLKRLKQRSPSIVDSLRLLLFRSAPLIINKTNVSELIRNMHNDTVRKSCESLLQQVSSLFPDIYETALKDIKEMILQNQSSVSPETLKTVSQYCLRKKSFDLGHEVLAILEKLCFEGTDTQAKYSAVILTTVQDATYQERMRDKLLDNLTYSDKTPTVLASLSKYLLIKGNLLLSHEERITEFLVKNVIRAHVSDPNITNTPDDVWLQFSELDYHIRSKVLALKCLTNMLTYNKNKDDREQRAAPILKLLSVILLTNGDMDPEHSTPYIHAAWLRLSAARFLLKLAVLPEFEPLVTFQTFLHLCLLCQDSIYEVRQEFVRRLQKLLQFDRLPARFHAAIFLLAHDPEAEFLGKVRTWAKSRSLYLRKHKNYINEYVLTYLIHLLAHHPDLNIESTESLLSFLKYFEFYLDVVMFADNVSLLYHLAQRVKQYRDTISETSDAIYYLSELARIAIFVRANVFGWAIPSFPKQIRLPHEIYKVIEVPDEKKITQGKTFLSSEIEQQVEQIVKANIRSNHHTAALKRSKPALSGTPKKRSTRTSRARGRTTARSVPKRKQSQQLKNALVSSPTRKSLRTRNRLINYQESPSENEEIEDVESSESEEQEGISSAEE
ncbi:cohesin-associated protein Pds5 [Schizosaccharomyces japonicus yFS275]|uniref:Cohesin-associated protein Pds5 n=1 Tax=Schizosaccharomyces japonicus (strain yFS275 / FY16936) TaxID=402676 RepID=B6K706_SCHJY|nr:cohesin-associated protein Pds5 [Schizosaccharomyces japonicus yFS275]EEB09310.1 cohesin-associated protein Pds5 [Schizosaccharomyces japonicus yFS275]